MKLGVEDQKLGLLPANMEVRLTRTDIWWLKEPSRNENWAVTRPKRRWIWSNKIIDPSFFLRCKSIYLPNSTKKNAVYLGFFCDNTVLDFRMQPVLVVGSPKTYGKSMLFLWAMASIAMLNNQYIYIIYLYIYNTL